MRYRLNYSHLWNPFVDIRKTKEMKRKKYETFNYTVPTPSPHSSAKNLGSNFKGGVSE